MKTKSVQTAVVIFLLLPVAGLVRLSIGNEFSFDFLFFLRSLSHSILLAVLSSIFSVFLGFFGALGLAGYPRLIWVRSLALAPTVLPSLFVLIALLGSWSPFPFGWVGSVVGLVLLSGGVVAVGLSHLIGERLVGISEASLVMGVPRWKFILKVLLPLLQRDLMGCLALVFGFAFSSFAVPFVLGAGEVRTLEYAVYQLAYKDMQYWPAILVGLLQFMLLFGLNWTGSQGPYVSSASQGRAQILRSPFFLIWTLLPSFVLSIGVLRSLVGGRGWSMLVDQRMALLSGWLGTMFLGITVGVTLVVALRYSLVAVISPSMMRLLLAFQSPSTVLISLGWWGLVMIPLSQISPLVSGLLLVGVLVSTCFCILLRMSWAGRLSQLRQQVEISRVLGASDGQIAKDILWPQMRQTGWRLGGIAALWASGDFTYSTLLSGQDWTLGLIAESYLGFYRIDTAMLVTGLIILSGGTLFWIFGKVANGFDQGS